jgi:hypothetical protein
MKDPVEATSKSGLPYFKLSAVVNDGVNEQGVWWNMTVMAPLMSKLRELGAESVVAKKGYAKFVGLASHRPWKGQDGVERISNDMLVNGIELQNGTYVRPDGSKQTEDEDAPF